MSQQPSNPTPQKRKSTPGEDIRQGVTFLVGGIALIVVAVVIQSLTARMIHIEIIELPLYLFGALGILVGFVGIYTGIRRQQ
jgi:hypothetical protein